MMTMVQRLYTRQFKTIMLSSIVLLTILAIHNRFVVDDAFISFRYSQNLAGGKGLVWNEGELVEGYTNFLWTLLMTIPFFLGIDPVIFSWAAGISISVLTLWLTFRLASLILGSRHWGLLATVLLGTNYSFSAFATSGLETQLQARLFVACAYVACDLLRQGIKDDRVLLLLSLLIALVLLTRLDSGIFVAITGMFVLFHIRRREWSGRLRKAATLIVPAAFIIGAWLLWKLSYYHDILPNTFHAKAASLSTFGLKFYPSFLLTYWLLPFFFLGLAYLYRLIRSASLPQFYLLAAMTAWAMYVALVGDFMEFRMLVPILSFMFIFLAWLIRESTGTTALRAGMAVVVVLGSLAHSYSFNGYFETVFKGRYFVSDSVSDLSADITERRFADIGKTLGELFEYNQEVTIATGPAGAIPFHAGLRTVDMHGLNDLHVNQTGCFRPYYPVAGHKQIATLSHLQEQNVNLVLGGFPDRLRPHAGGGPYTLADLPNLSVEAPPGARIIEVPLDEGTVIAVLYLNGKAFIDGAIASHGLRTYAMEDQPGGSGQQIAQDRQMAQD